MNECSDLELMTIDAPAGVGASDSWNGQVDDA